MSDPAIRREAALRAVHQAGAEALFVTFPPNIRYLTGFTGSSAVLVLAASGPMLVTDGRYEAQVARECPGLPVHIRTPDQLTEAVAAEIVGKLALRSLAIEAQHLSVAQFELIRERIGITELMHDSGSVDRLRQIKDAGEIAVITQAVRIAERAFEMFRSMLRAADSEKELADAMDSYLRRAGAIGSSFSVIIAAGETSALPHAKPDPNRRLGDYSHLLVDWGADLGYKSDLTRTFPTPFATPSHTGYHFEELFAAVAQAHDVAVSLLRAGASVQSVDQAARHALSQVSLKDYPGDIPPDLARTFSHGLGHGLGLEIHESPRLRPNAPDLLAEGMVITIEPGIYLPGWGGIRLEDDYQITADGAIRLSRLPREISFL